MKFQKFVVNIITATFMLTIFFLAITSSMYVEWNEIWLIAISVSIICIIMNQFLLPKQSIIRAIILSAITGFVLCYALAFLDLVVDHFKVIQGIPDGKFLTLSETIHEFSRELNIIALIGMFVVLLVSVIGEMIFHNSKTQK